MASKLDVAGRLAEARQAVDNTQSYVWACHLLNYQNPDLTSHPAKIREWFGTEEGMDLHVLDADFSAWQSAAAAADDALGRERDQLGRLSSAWQGSGATSAEDFVRRHCDAAEKVAASVRTVAETLASLRDALWQIVDTKTAAVMSIDDRRRAERPAWLAAAQTVTTGVGDRAAASEIVDQQVKPFVDKDIRVDWLSAVRTAIASIGSSYDAATAELTSVSPARFDIPGDFGPDSARSSPDDVRAPASTPAAATAPAPSGASPSYSSPSGTTMNSPPSTAPMYSPPSDVPTGAAVPASAGTATPGAATPGAAQAMPAAPISQLEGLPQRVADALGELLPSSDKGAEADSEPPDPPSEESTDHEPPDEDERAIDSTDDETDCRSREHAQSAEPAPMTGVDNGAPAEALALPPEEAAGPAEPPAPPAGPPELPPEAPVDGAATPCEIAAAELPQAGQ